MSVRIWLPLVCVLFCALGADAQTATLLKDINTSEDVSFASNPYGFVEWNDNGYFFASSSPGVRGLWRTDGTAAGTRLVKNNFQIAAREPIVSGGMLFFAADDGVHGGELWKTDGTPEGTVLVKDVNPGPGDGIPTFYPLFGADGGGVFFIGNDGVTGPALWKSDGSEAGTVLVKDINPSDYDGPGILGYFNGAIYLAASEGINGRELWRSDGTAAGTALVKEINPGSQGTFFSNFIAVDDAFYFASGDDLSGQELWRSDGTTAGTTLVLDLNPGASDGLLDGPFAVPGVADVMFLYADDGSGPGLWKSDGTAAGTVRILEDVKPSGFASVGQSIFFVELGSALNRLWKTDGTAEGTSVVTEIAGIGSRLTSLGPLLFFHVAADEGFSLWKTDGTQLGTALVKEFPEAGYSNPGGLVVRSNPLVAGSYLFVAGDGTHGREVWKTTGDEASTVLVKDIGIAPGDASPDEFRSVGAELYFTANDGIDGRAEWKTDGTENGSVALQEAQPGAREPGYFSFDDGINGRELWKTDGSEAGTFLVKDVNPGAADGVAESPEMVTIGQTLFFAADDGVHGSELWKTNGTADGTVMVRDVFPEDGQGSDPQSLVNLNGTLLFQARGYVSRTELWGSDGTEEGTVRIKAPAGGFGGLRQTTVLNGLVYYLDWHPAPGYALWRTDGSDAGTIELKRLGDAFEPSPELAAINGKLILSFRNTLWTTDGTEEGTVLVKTFEPVPGEHETVSQLTRHNDALYFVVPHPAGQRDLWKTDGTEAGAVPVGELPDNAATISKILGSYAGSLYLDVQEGLSSNSLHHLARIQGTSETTYVDDAPFIGGLEPFLGAGSNVYFAGTSEETGRELWTLPLLPAISSAGVVDAAGYLPTLAPGSLASLFGVELAGDTAAASGFPLPTILAGAKVKVNGIDAPLLFVSPTQINFQVPYGTPPDAGVTVVAWLNGQQSLSEPTAVAEFAPAIFVNPATGEPIVQRHADGSLISAQNPAKPGDTLILYITGIGGLDNPPATGAAATESPLATATTAPTVLVGGVEATVLFAGLAPNFAGLGQINIVLPGTLPEGSPLPLTIRFGDSVSPELELPF